MKFEIHWGAWSFLPPPRRNRTIGLSGIVSRFVVGRFCRALTLGIEAGLSLDRVTELAVAAAAHPELTRHLNRVPRRQRAGQPLSKTFAGTTVLPPNVVAALEVAEASGDYGGTVRKLAELYDGGYA